MEISNVKFASLVLSATALAIYQPFALFFLPLFVCFFTLHDNGKTSKGDK